MGIIITKDTLKKIYNDYEANKHKIIQKPIIKDPPNNFDVFKSNLADKKDLMSGGEKQRICIARAFLKNPTILLLDEATSALDKNSELEVQKSLDELSLNRTCINISHRLNVIQNYDKIFVLQRGKIKEEGNHHELMNLKGLYYNLQRYANL